MRSPIMIKEIPLASPNFLVYCVIYVQLKMIHHDVKLLAY
jgi:hypothetical protein